jgi:hypothetical protein
MEPNPRTVRRSVTIEADWRTAAEATKEALHKMGAKSVVLEGHVITAKTGATLRTWGQFVQGDFKEASPTQCELDLATWPSRDLQTIDTHAGGRMALKRFITQLREDNPQLRVSDL